MDYSSWSVSVMYWTSAGLTIRINHSRYSSIIRVGKSCTKSIRISNSVFHITYKSERLQSLCTAQHLYYEPRQIDVNVIH